MADRLVVLREGRVQQIGTPAELHNNPSNWHVADFMGYRNLVDLEVVKAPTDAAADTAVTVADKGFSLRGNAIGPASVGETVRVAIRPEDLTVVSSSTPIRGGNTTTATVSVVEYHGREFAVGVTTAGGHTLHVRSDQAPAIGSTVELTADPTRVLVYPLELATSAQRSVEEIELAEVRG